VRIERNGDPVAELGPGQFFGEIALLEDNKRTATVATATRVRAAVMDQADFFEMTAQIPAISKRITDAAIARFPKR
jgi:voltage-gated potassium channel